MLRYVIGIVLLLFLLIKIRDAMRESVPVPASVEPRQKPQSDLKDAPSAEIPAPESDALRHNGDPLFTFL